MKHRVQARVKEVTAHEDELAAWKQRFKAEALRQIGERERALSQWQAQLEAQHAESARLRSDAEAPLPLWALMLNIRNKSRHACLHSSLVADPSAALTRFPLQTAIRRLGQVLSLHSVYHC